MQIQNDFQWLAVTQRNLMLAQQLEHYGTCVRWCNSCTVNLCVSKEAFTVSSIHCVINTFSIIHCQLEETTTEEEFHQLICSSDYEFVLECGVTKPAVMMHLADKEKIISAVCLHYAVLGSLAELEQLRRGLHTLRFSVQMESYPFLFKQLFLHCNTSVTADWFVPRWLLGAWV